MLKTNLDKLIVLDIETLSTMFCICCRDYKTGAKKQFIIYDDPEYDDQPLALFKFLRNCRRQGYTAVTFNGLAFDLQVLNFFYEWCSVKVEPLYELELSEVIKFLYSEAQRIINLDEEAKHKELVFEGDLFMPTIDLFKQKHYDRPQRYTSLKWCQFTMNYPNIEEMPIPHDQPITKDEIADVLSYCWNDVDSTYQFFELIKYESEVRLKLSEEYGRNLINASEPKMAREIFGKFLCDEMKISYAELRKMNTIRKMVKFADIIFPYVKFITPTLQKVLTDLQAVSIDCNPHSKQSFEYSFDYNGLTVYLGLGGIHACLAPGVYVPAEDEICEDVDVISFYPKLGIENDVKPAHLGGSFSKIYNSLFEQRKLIPKEDPRNYIFKILLNSTYGLSSEINSYFYDKQYTYTITVNGQLSLLMLAEALHKSVPGIKVLQMNTDGLTIIYNKQYNPMVAKICAWWERTTKLGLEYAYYSKMVIQDVNNYIGVYTDVDKKPKCKGLFDTKIEYHKNPSYLIVPKALTAYFVKGVPIEQTVKTHNNIYDFCGGIKKKRSFALNLYKDFGNSEVCEEQQKVTRFFISTPTDEAGLLVKDFTDGRKVSALANTLVQPLNNIRVGYEQPARYPINYDWYVREAKKLVESITPSVTQQSLF